MKEYKIKLRILTPVHIGTGEVFEPLSFFVKEEGILVEVDFSKICQLIAKSEKGKKEFLNLAQKGTPSALLELYRLFDSICKGLYKHGKRDFVKREIEVCRGLVEHYLDFIKSGREFTDRVQQEFKKFEIFKTAFSLNEKEPFIPGSSLKGSIRTAVLNYFKNKAKGKSAQDYLEVKEKGKKRKNYRADKLEKEILNYGNPEEDPFKLIKVSDLRAINGVKTRIVYAVNRKKTGERARGPYQILEVIEAGAEFEGKIIFMEEFRVKWKIKERDVFQALNEFYQKEFKKEAEILKGLRIEADWISEGCLVKLGKHSGAECMTVEGFRAIKVKTTGGRVKELPYATTIWLASEDRKGENLIAPFGWAILKLKNV
jgi:CRISPR-associated protein Csm5